jgi:hypothetical protein
MAHSVKVDTSEISDNFNASRYALCAMLLKSKILYTIQLNYDQRRRL